LNYFPKSPRPEMLSFGTHMLPAKDPEYKHFETTEDINSRLKTYRDELLNHFSKTPLRNSFISCQDFSSAALLYAIGMLNFLPRESAAGFVNACTELE